MRVAFNAHLLSFARTYRSAGISRYISNLLAQLRRQRSHDYTIHYPGGALPRELSPANGFTWTGTRVPTGGPWGRMVWEQAIQPLALIQHGAQVVHAPAYVAPLASPCPVVLTIHDLSFLRMPDAFKRLNRVYLATLTRLSARRARRIIAVSDATRADTVRLLGVPAERIHVIYHGIESSFRPIADSDALAAFRRRNGFVGGYLLYLGTLEPRKNVETIVRAYAEARQRGGVRQPLVLAGGRGWRDEGIFALVRDLKLDDHVLFPGFVPFEDQPYWYGAATAFVYPSRLEGFGFPVLEAMACGTPVITSNQSSLPEVGGDAALYVNPDDVSGLAEAMVRLVEDRALAADLRERGLRRATQFSWASAAQRTERVYECCLGLSAPPEEESLLVQRTLELKPSRMHLD